MTERATIDQTPAAQAPQPEDACPCDCNREASQQLFDTMPDEELLYDLADLFKVFADTTRIKILFALMNHEMPVGELAEAIGATQSAVSHQLRQLKQALCSSRTVFSCSVPNSCMRMDAASRIYTLNYDRRIHAALSSAGSKKIVRRKGNSADDSFAGGSSHAQAICVVSHCCREWGKRREVIWLDACCWYR